MIALTSVQNQSASLLEMRPKSAKTTKRDKVAPASIDLLFHGRWHGAVNIRGIRYQILYSLLEAFRLFDAPPECDSTIQLEGMEDADLKGIWMETEYIQIKTSEQPWSWSRLKSPLAGFLEVLRTASKSRFRLAVNFPLSGDIRQLSAYSNLSKGEQTRLARQFCILCTEIGASRFEAQQLLQRLKIVSMDEVQLWQQLRVQAADRFALGTEAVDVYLLVFVAKFIGWATERRDVSIRDMQSVRTEIGETLSEEEAFLAFGRGLIERISWDPDASPADFLDGKGARPGHITLGIDVPRPAWIVRVHSAIAASKVCIIRSASGQGKTTLQYRYAREHWNAEQTYILRIAQTCEHVALVVKHLRFRSGLGLPLLLLVDGAGASTRLWSEIARECTALGIRVLVTVRNEDWYRFRKESLTSFEIIEPTLALEEARDIWKGLRAAGAVHSDVRSAEWAYERIGKPALLLEYTYLLTHGQMLRDRLTDQVAQFRELGEDPAKIALLRKASVAHAFGASVSTRKLLTQVSLRDDPQDVLASLHGEYMIVDADTLRVLHWVRSDHMLRILHEGYPALMDSAVEVRKAIEPRDLARFIAGALVAPGIDPATFIDRLGYDMVNAPLGEIIAVLDGLFEGGERLFLQRGKDCFDQAYHLNGASGIAILGALLSPLSGHRIQKHITKLGNHGNFPDVLALAQRVTGQRGLDYCAIYLTSVAPHVSESDLREDLELTGRLLHWLGLCSVTLPAFNTFWADLAQGTSLLSVDKTTLTRFADGIGRYNKAAYKTWLDSNREAVEAYLRITTDSFSLVVSPQASALEYLIDGTDERSINNQSVSRLEVVGSVAPFSETYRVQGYWLGSFPQLNDSFKNMPRENVSLPSDIEKDILWNSIADKEYSPDSYYLFMESWHSLRRYSLVLVKTLTKCLTDKLEGRHTNLSLLNKAFAEVVDPFRQLPAFSETALTRVGRPDLLPSLDKEALKAPNDWSSSLHNFSVQFARFTNDGEERMGRLALSNFKGCVHHLPGMQQFFALLFSRAADYFGSQELDQTELSAYDGLLEPLAVWVEGAGTRVPSLRKYIADCQSKRHLGRVEWLRSVAHGIENEGVSVSMTTNYYEEHPFCHSCLAFHVRNPFDFGREIVRIAQVISTRVESDDCWVVWTIPLFRGGTFLGGAYRFSRTSASELLTNPSESWLLVPLALPAKAEALLPSMNAVSIPAFDLMTRLERLRLELEVCAEQEKRIAPLGASGFASDRILFQRHADRLVAWRRQALDSGTDILKDTHARFTALADSPALKELASSIDDSRDGNFVKHRKLERAVATLIAVLQAHVRASGDFGLPEADVSLETMDA